MKVLLVSLFLLIGCTQAPSENDILEAAERLTAKKADCQTIADSLGLPHSEYASETVDRETIQWLCRVHTGDSYNFNPLVESNGMFFYDKEIQPIIRYLNGKKRLAKPHKEKRKVRTKTDDSIEIEVIQ